MPPGRNPLRESEAHVATPVERKEVHTVGLSRQIVAQSDVEALLLSFDRAADRRVDDKCRLLALTDLLNSLKTQHD
jgi:hypothetical protein